MGREGKTRLLLTQSIAPNVVPPPPVDRIMKGGGPLSMVTRFLHM